MKTTYTFKCHRCNEFTEWKYLRPLIGKHKNSNRNLIQVTLRPYSVYRCLKCGVTWWGK